MKIIIKESSLSKYGFVEVPNKKATIPIIDAIA